jgi:hypothetical protein
LGFGARFPLPTNHQPPRHEYALRTSTRGTSWGMGKGKKEGRGCLFCPGPLARANSLSATAIFNIRPEGHCQALAELAARGWCVAGWGSRARAHLPPGPQAPNPPWSAGCVCFVFRDRRVHALQWPSHARDLVRLPSCLCLRCCYPALRQCHLSGVHLAHLQVASRPACVVSVGKS